jgi:hypothetical protein
MSRDAARPRQTRPNFRRIVCAGARVHHAQLTHNYSPPSQAPNADLEDPLALVALASRVAALATLGHVVATAEVSGTIVKRSIVKPARLAKHPTRTFKVIHRKVIFKQ